MNDGLSPTAGKAQAGSPAPVSTLVAGRVVSRVVSFVKPGNLAITLREWHKRAGLFAFLFMGWLGFSGILINESATFGYDTLRIDWPWVMSLYGLHAEAPPSGYSSHGHTLALTSDYTLIDSKPLPAKIADAHGMVAGGSPLQYFIAGGDGVVVLDDKGGQVDEISSPALPVSTVRRIGFMRAKPDWVVVQDLDAFASADAGLTWAPVSPTDVTWSELSPISEADRARLLPWSRPSVSVEHVLVDAHSGRIFGNWGAYVINAVGIAAILLAISGVWMWWRTRQRRRSAGR